MPLYKNLDGTTPDKGLTDILKWQWDRLRTGKGRERDPFVTPRVDNDGSKLASLDPHLTWIGHASFALRLGGKLVVTDPIFSDRIQGAIKRRVQPGVAAASLPAVDVVTVSHTHYDHLDIPSLKLLGRSPTYVVPRDVAELLHEADLPNVIELGWWESTQVGDLTITFVPAQHWSMRVPWDRNRRLWGGFVYSAPDGTAYHAGDTAYSEQVFRQIGERFSSIDWALMPIGAYEPAWFMKPQHMGPDEAVRAFRDLGAKKFVAMHWGTFKLTDEPMGEPPERLLKLFRENGAGATSTGKLDDPTMWIMDIGETRPLVR